ncbi:MAG: methyl-accepting chemotaxis protein [Granulosicoccus sp.]
MAVHNNAFHENRIGLPAVLLSLCLLALVVSLFGLFRTSGVTQTRVNDLQISWQTLMEDGVDGAEVVATNRLMQGVVRPVPAVYSAAGWSLALGALSLVFFGWLLLTVRSVQRKRASGGELEARNDQAATARLLDEMAPLASGDLRVRATASDGTAGALADAFNHAVSELQRLAGIQLSTSRTLGESVSKSQELATAIERQCTQQTGHIHQSSNVLLGMSSSTGALSANAAETSVTTQVILDKVDHVHAALKASSKQIDSMRRDSDLSVSLVQSLSQYVHPIEDSFAVLEDLARHTELLAVNTTIRASSVSATADLGSDDVSRLTDEVARLGDALGRATDDVRSLIRSISVDSTEAITCMRRVYSGCDKQFVQMDSLADALAQIRTHTSSVHTHAVHVAEEAVVHAGVVRNLSENMNLINQITEQTGQDARTNAASMDGLKRLANDLRQSTSDFILTDSDVNAADTQPTKSVARRAAERAAING